ncbi:MAG: hypothetical protein IIY07_05750, partial [Thermoguttaceae bacterium]|nr:hypothetical protein [Thermoguttaceae bacterium]
LSVFELQSKARKLVKEHKIQMIIIDYLQLMNANGMNFGSPRRSGIRRRCKACRRLRPGGTSRLPLDRSCS